MKKEREQGKRHGVMAWQVDLRSYSDSMTLSTLISVNHVEQVSGTLGAFVGAELRGVQASPSHAPFGAYAHRPVYQIIIYANAARVGTGSNGTGTAVGETVCFWFDNNSNKLVELQQGIELVINSNIGRVTSPFQLSGAARCESSQSGTRTPERRLHYMRIAKTGSTTLLKAIDAAQEEWPRECAHVWTGGKGHEMTADMLAASSSSPPLSFAVLREPCERFVSVYAYQMGLVTPRVRLPRARLLKRRDAVPQLLVGSGHSNKGGRARDLAPPLDRLRRSVGPASWAQQLLNDTLLRAAFLRRKKGGARPLSGAHSLTQRLSWPQSVYVSPSTHIACLPTMLRDVQRIFNDHAPGCVLPPTPSANAAERKRWVATEAVCNAVGLLYPEDVALWQRHCRSPQAQRGRGGHYGSMVAGEGRHLAHAVMAALLGFMVLVVLCRRRSWPMSSISHIG